MNPASDPAAVIWHQEPDSDIWTLLGTSTNPIDPGRLVEASLTEDELAAWPPYLAARRTASLAARLVEMLDLEMSDSLLAELGVDGVLESMIDSTEQCHRSARALEPLLGTSTHDRGVTGTMDGCAASIRRSLGGGPR